jgi:hypothetical protein
MKKILIYIDENLLIRIDENVKIIGLGANRSAFIRQSCETFLDLKKGFSNRIRKRELNEIHTNR